MQKFILTNQDTLKYGDVNMHKDLLAPGEYCLGGGFYEFDYVSNRLLLSGRSYDFGKPKWHCCDTVKVPSAFLGLTILWEDEPLENFVKIEYV